MQTQIITALLAALFLSACGGPTYRTVEVAPQKPTTVASQPAPAPPDTPADPSTNPSRPVPLEGYRRLEWKTLRGLDVRTGKGTPDVTALAGANVKIAGFMVPFDDEDENVTEFLLVPQAGMCIHTPPPPPNQIILVEVGATGTHRVEWDKEVQVYGQFQIAEGSSPYGKTGFRLSAVRARPE